LKLLPLPLPKLLPTLPPLVPVLLRPLIWSACLLPLPFWLSVQLLSPRRDNLQKEIICFAKAEAAA